jgi:hypothetical protein
VVCLAPFINPDTGSRSGRPAPTLPRSGHHLLQSETAREFGGIPPGLQKSLIRVQLRPMWNDLQLTLSYQLLLFFAAFAPKWEALP